MTLAAFFGLHERGWIVYHLVVIVATHVLAYFSWHLIESPAMSLKNWTPRFLDRFIAYIRPGTTYLREELVDVNYSSTPFARRLRERHAAENKRQEVERELQVAQNFTRQRQSVEEGA